MKKDLDKEVEICDCCEVHENLLQIVNETIPEENELYDLAELFKVFGDSTRIRILFVLFEAEVCVCDLAKALNMTQSAISHQLRILKQNKLVKSRRDGKSKFYSLADEHVRTIIDQGREHIEVDFLTAIWYINYTYGFCEGVVCVKTWFVNSRGFDQI